MPRSELLSWLPGVSMIPGMLGRNEARESFIFLAGNECVVRAPSTEPTFLNSFLTCQLVVRVLEPPRRHEVRGAGRLVDGRRVGPHEVERRLLLQRDRHLEALRLAAPAAAAAVLVHATPALRGTARGCVVIVHHLQRHKNIVSS